MTVETPKNLNDALAAELRARIAVKNTVTRGDLAEASGLSYRQVLRLLQGERDIDVRTLAAFSIVLAEEPANLIAEAGKRLSGEKQ